PSGRQRTRAASARTAESMLGGLHEVARQQLRSILMASRAGQKTLQRGRPQRRERLGQRRAGGAIVKAPTTSTRGEPWPVCVNAMRVESAEVAVIGWVVSISVLLLGSERLLAVHRLLQNEGHGQEASRLAPRGWLDHRRALRGVAGLQSGGPGDRGLREP